MMASDCVPGQHGGFGLDDFDAGGAVAVREIDDSADFHVRTGEDVLGKADGVGLDARGRHVVLPGQFATFSQVGIRHGRMQQRVVDHLGQFLERGIVHGFRPGGSVHRFGVLNLVMPRRRYSS
jgi:hypothetical protein